MRPNYTTLAIIGNGFDLAHGYDTTYRSFVDSMKSEVLDEFRQICDDEAIVTWYDFENNIKELSLNLYQKAIMGDEAPEVYDAKIAHANDIFKKLHKILTDYLKAETMNHPVRKLRSIRRFISRHTMLINFNYTSTPEAYSGDVFYVNGSLAEDNILLGYDYRDEPCLIGMDFMYWSKNTAVSLWRFNGISNQMVLCLLSALVIFLIILSIIRIVPMLQGVLTRKSAARYVTLNSSTLLLKTMLRI